MKNLTILILAFLCATILASEIKIRDFEVWNKDHSGWWNAIWCAITVEDPNGNFVTNLQAKDFIITETIYDSNGEEVDTHRAVFNDKFNQFNGSGFWEESVTTDKLDIVFLIDNTGSMKKYIDNIKKQLKDFLARLYQNNTDFRIVIAEYETSNDPSWPAKFEDPVRRFCGPLMREEIEQQIDSIWAAHESWNLQWGYDAFLWALNLNWREDARKIVVIITDVFTDSVHGPNWYFSDGCVTSPYAVHHAMKDKKIALYFCQPEKDQMASTEVECNYSEKINPLVEKMDFDFLLTVNSLTKKLSWPFNQSEIELFQNQLLDSKYYFSWVSDFSKLTDLQKKSASKVVVSVRLFGDVNPVSFSFYIKDSEGKISKETADLTIRLKDEAGNPLNNKAVTMYLYKSLGTAAARIDLPSVDYRQQNNQDSIVKFRRISTGKYFYIVESYSTFDGYENQLGYYSTGWITVQQDGPKEFDLTVQTIYKETNIYRFLGLIEELRNMKVATKSVQDLADQLLSWLAGLQSDNAITNAELEAIIRMNFGLGALINCSHYASVEYERSVEDILQITQKVMSMISRARKVAEDLNEKKELMISASRTFLDILTANWSGVAAKTTIEILVQKVLSYVQNQILEDILNAVLKKLQETMLDPDKLAIYLDGHIRKAVSHADQYDFQKGNVESFVLDSLVSPIFVEKMYKEIGQLLDEANRFLKTNYGQLYDIYDHSSSMRQSFQEFRSAYMRKLYADAARHLSDQKLLDDWQSVLSVLTQTIPMITEFLELFEITYPEFKPLRESLESLYEVFDNIRTITQTYELALKMNHLRSMQPIISKISSFAFTQ